MHKKWRGQLGEAAKLRRSLRALRAKFLHDVFTRQIRIALPACASSMILLAIIALASSSLSASRRAMQAISNATPMTRRVSGSYATPFNSMAQFPCLTCSILDTWGPTATNPRGTRSALSQYPTDGRTGPSQLQFPPANYTRTVSACEPTSSQKEEQRCMANRRCQWKDVLRLSDRHCRYRAHSYGDLLRRLISA